MEQTAMHKAREDWFFEWEPEISCLGCRHYRAIHNHAAPRRSLVCHYLLDTGHARGCPFGSGCVHR